MSDPTDADTPPSPELAALLDALAHAPREDELVDEASVVASMQSVIAPAGTTRGASMTRAQKRLRIAAISAAGFVAVGGAAAAQPGGFDPVDRPPTIDAPPAVVPPVSLPATAQGRRPEQAATTPPTSSPTTTLATTTPGAAEPDSTTITAVDPGEVTCAEGNHGDTVSSVAQVTPPGPDHGPIVAAAAHSDCGKQTVAVDPVEPSTGGGSGQPTEPGPPADSPANTAPGQAGDPGPPAGSPANTAPGRTGDTGQGRRPGG
jgi:hypothetical protein